MSEAHLDNYDPYFFDLISKNENGAYDDMRQILPTVCSKDFPYIGKKYGKQFRCAKKPLVWNEKTCPEKQPLAAELGHIRKEFPSMGVGGCKPNELSVIRDGHLCCSPAEPWMSPDILNLNRRLLAEHTRSENTLDQNLLLSPTRFEELALLLEKKLTHDSVQRLLERVRNGEFDSSEDDETLDDQDENLDSKKKQDIKDMDEREEREETLEQFVVNHAFRNLGLGTLKGHEKNLAILYENEKKRIHAPLLPSFPEFLNRVEKQLHERWKWIENRVLSKKT